MPAGASSSDLIVDEVRFQNRVSCGVKRTGDGSIVEFRSVVDAVRCAIEVQNAMVERNAGLPEDRRIVFRIGIHIGDVVEESDRDLMGDGVNIAARLEGASGGGPDEEKSNRPLPTREHYRFGRRSGEFNGVSHNRLEVGRSSAVGRGGTRPGANGCPWNCSKR